MTKSKQNNGSNICDSAKKKNNNNQLGFGFRVYRV